MQSLSHHLHHGIFTSGECGSVPHISMLDWTTIDTVLLDMDGTLLDLHFDNHFWLEYLPKCYGEQYGLPLAQARSELLARYNKVKNTLEWYCVDYWSTTLGLDVVALKQEVGHLIAVHPHVLNFLQALQQMHKRRILVSNAHRKSIAIKMARTTLASHLERIISAHDLGLPKEHPNFWMHLQNLEAFNPQRTLFIDDTISALTTAKIHGIRWLVAITHPDSQKPGNNVVDFPAIRDFATLIPNCNYTLHG